MKKIMYDYKNRTFLLNMIDFHYDYALLPSIRYIERISLNERRTDDVAVLGASATSWRGFCTFLRKRRDNRQWRKFGVKRSLVSRLCISTSYAFCSYIIFATDIVINIPKPMLIIVSRACASVLSGSS